MAQTSFKFDRVSQQTPADLAHKQLEVEKVGVIVGFLVGLPLAVGFVSEALEAHATPEWLVTVAMVATVAATTAVGLRMGTALAARLGTRR
jgi:membrane protein YdbS with pleckstrin-like domain